MENITHLVLRVEVVGATIRPLGMRGMRDIQVRHTSQQSATRAAKAAAVEEPLCGGRLLVVNAANRVVCCAFRHSENPNCDAWPIELSASEIAWIHNWLHHHTDKFRASCTCFGEFFDIDALRNAQ